MGIETATEALGMRIDYLLSSSGFLTSGQRLEIDPEAPFEPQGDEEELVTAAALVRLPTNPVRQILGRPEPRYVVERSCRLELALAGPSRFVREAVNHRALSLLAALPAVSPTLDGVTERLLLTDREDDVLPPNGVAIFLTFLLRVRSGDPLGLSD